MKPKYLAKLFVLVLTCALTLGATGRSSERERMGIFISNFTETGMYVFDITDGLVRNASQKDMGDLCPDDLIRFGIAHNIINNPKTTIKKCPRKSCPHGSSIISGASVSASIRKYFDLDIRNRTLTDGNEPGAYYDGTDYHFDVMAWRGELEQSATNYAEAQHIIRRKGLVKVEGELYDYNNKANRLGRFIASAKPHEWQGKDTWAVISLSVEWYDEE